MSQIPLAHTHHWKTRSTHSQHVFVLLFSIFNIFGGFSYRTTWWMQNTECPKLPHEFFLFWPLECTDVPRCEGTRLYIKSNLTPPARIWVTGWWPGQRMKHVSRNYFLSTVSDNLRNAWHAMNVQIMYEYLDNSSMALSILPVQWPGQRIKHISRNYSLLTASHNLWNACQVLYVQIMVPPHFCSQWKSL